MKKGSGDERVGDEEVEWRGAKDKIRPIPPLELATSLIRCELWPLLRDPNRCVLNVDFIH